MEWGGEIVRSEISSKLRGEGGNNSEFGGRAGREITPIQNLGGGGSSPRYLELGRQNFR